MKITINHAMRHLLQEMLSEYVDGRSLRQFDKKDILNSCGEDAATALLGKLKNSQEISFNIDGGERKLLLWRLAWEIQTQKQTEARSYASQLFDVLQPQGTPILA